MEITEILSAIIAIPFLIGLFILIVYVFIAAINAEGTTTLYRRRRRYYPRLTPEEKGIVGEYLVSKKLGGTIPGVQYIINDIILSDGTKTSQIDHIFINENGIFIIETKNYSGYIFGKDFDRNWVQILNKKIKNTFYNPVMQNNGHVNMLQKVTKTKLPIIPLVVFIEADISHVISNYTCSINELTSIVNKPRNKTITTKERLDLYNLINELDEKYGISNQEHANNLRNVVIPQTKNPRTICPICKGKLVKRRGKYGDFLGCSNFPKCQYTDYYKGF